MNYFSSVVKKSILYTAIAAMAFSTFGCSSPKEELPSEKSDERTPLQIGMSFDTFVLERWIRDRDIFVSTASDLGAEVNVQNANGDAEEQASQIEYLIDKGMDVLVIVAVDGTDPALSSAIKRAHDKGIKVLAYDRIIQNANADLYASFDNEEVGQLMAKSVLSQIPEDGTVAALYGSPADYNVVLVEKGIKKVLESTDIQLIYENYADNWKAEYAYEQMNECIDTAGKPDAVICGNDGLAAMAFKSLSEHRMADDICLVGQDADIDACQRIVEGNQYMTVYKSIDQLAKQSAQYAVMLARNEDLQLTETFNDGTYDVPYLKLEPIAVTKDNMDEEIIASRFHLKNEVYLNVDANEE